MEKKTKQKQIKRYNISHGTNKQMQDNCKPQTKAKTKTNKNKNNEAKQTMRSNAKE